MLSRIIHSLKILNIYDSAPILIKSGECEKYLRLSSIVHFPYNCPEEIIIVDSSARVTVKESEDSLNLSLISGNPVILHGLSKFTEIQSLRLVVVHNLENSADSINTSDTT
jgi:hypothetical protein